MQNLLRYWLASVLLAGCMMQAQTASVTAVAGESWLVHLNRTFGDTSMGKTGRLGPGPQEESRQIPSRAVITASRESVTLHGADLYRLNCQGCHGESGLGAPPEINSLINPVRATSVPLILARVRNVGMDMSYADAAKLAQQSNTALLDRLQKGGESMPAFPHLSEAEKSALLAYLKHLAGVPGAAAETATVKESRVRVGELIVKSTCHTCHGATGPDPGPRELMDGAIPPLSTLTSRKNESDFVRKVTFGAPVLMGTPPMPCRGRMPAFFYLTEEEAADVYLYLTLYPPTERTERDPRVAPSLFATPLGSNGPGSPKPDSAANTIERNDPDPTISANWKRIALFLVVALISSALAGGLIFTFREFKRLVADAAGRNATARAARAGLGTSGGMNFMERSERPRVPRLVLRGSRGGGSLAHSSSADTNLGSAPNTVRIER